MKGTHHCQNQGQICTRNQGIPICRRLSWNQISQNCIANKNSLYLWNETTNSYIYSQGVIKKYATTTEELAALFFISFYHLFQQLWMAGQGNVWFLRRLVLTKFLSGKKLIETVGRISQGWNSRVLETAWWLSRLLRSHYLEFLEENHFQPRLL